MSVPRHAEQALQHLHEVGHLEGPAPAEVAALAEEELLPITTAEVSLYASQHPSSFLYLEERAQRQPHLTPIVLLMGPTRWDDQQ